MPPEKKKRALIIGSNGRLGSVLADKFHSLYRRQFKLIRSPLSYTENKNLTKDKVSSARATLAINCVAYTDVDGCEKDRSRAELSNIQIARHAALWTPPSATFVHISTDFVYGDVMDFNSFSHSRILNETLDCKPVNYYGVTKLEGEKEVLDARRNAEGKTYIFRVSQLYSETYGFPFSIKNAKQQPIVPLDQLGRPTFTATLAIHLADILARCPYLESGIYNLGPSGTATSKYGVASLIRNVKGITSKEHQAMFGYPAKRQLNSLLDISKLEFKLGKTLNWDWQKDFNEYFVDDKFNFEDEVEEDDT